MYQQVIQQIIEGILDQPVFWFGVGISMFLAIYALFFYTVLGTLLTWNWFREGGK